MLINKRENVDTKHYSDPKAFIEIWSDVSDTQKNIDDYSPGKKWKVFLVFGGIIANVVINKKLNEMVAKVFVRGRKLNVSFVSHNHTLWCQGMLD